MEYTSEVIGVKFAARLTPAGRVRRLMFYDEGAERKSVVAL